MALEWAIDVGMIRDALGVAGSGLDDAQLLAPVVVRPVVFEVLGICPSLGEVADPDAQELVKIAVASMVAANVMRSMPEITSSRLGDSTVTFADGDASSRSSRLMAQGRDMIDEVCPVPQAQQRPAALFRVVASGRGR